MAATYFNPAPFYVDDTGVPIVGAQLYFFAAGTTTPLVTYSDDAFSTPNAHPVVSGSGGIMPAIFIQSVDFKVRCDDENDVTRFTRDNVEPASGGSVAIGAVPDNVFRIAGSSDVTKLLAWEVDGQTTGITRTRTTIDADGVEVLQDNTQTLGGKTLTSPVLNGTLSGTAFLDEDDMSSNSAIAAASQQSIKAHSDNQRTATYTTLKAMTAGLYSSVVVESLGRAGLFAWDGTDRSADVTKDTGEGIVVPPDSDSTGASGVWERRYDSLWQAAWFGDFSETDSSTTNAATLQAAIDYASYYLVARSGGTKIEIPKGTFELDQVILRQGVVLIGKGVYSTKLRLPAASTDSSLFITENYTDLIASDNWFADADTTGNTATYATAGDIPPWYTTAVATDKMAVPVGFGLKGMTLWGDGQNTNSGQGNHGLEWHGKGFILDEIIIFEFDVDGIRTQCGFSGGQSGNIYGYKDLPECQVGTVFIKECGGNGWRHRGPHDLKINNLIAADCGGDGFSAEYSVNVYNGTVDLGWAHIYSNDIGLRTATNCSFGEIIVESNSGEGYITNVGRSSFMKLTTYNNNRGHKTTTTSTHEIDIQSAAVNTTIDFLHCRAFQDGKSGPKIQADEVVIGQLQIDGTEGNTNSGTAFDVYGVENLLIGVAHIQDFNGVGGVGFRWNNTGNTKNLSVGSLTVNNCLTLLQNSGTGVNERLFIRGKAEAGQTQFSGTTTVARDSYNAWDILLEDNVGAYTHTQYIGGIRFDLGAGDRKVSLDADASSDALLSLSNGGTERWSMGLDGTASFFVVNDVVNSLVPLVIEPNAANDAIYVKANDRVGIFENSPSYKFDVAGTLRCKDQLIFERDTVAPAITLINSSYGGGNAQISYFNSGAVAFLTNATIGMTLDNAQNLDVTVGNLEVGATAVIDSNRIHINRSYTVATLPTGVTGGTIYVSDETGGATLAFYNGSNWVRVQDLAIVS